MPIDLTAQESRPTVTRARLRTISIDIIGHVIVTVVEFGYVVNGTFTPVRTTRFTYTDDSAPTFAQAIAQNPALLTARDQIETYYAGTVVPGTVV